MKENEIKRNKDNNSYKDEIDKSHNVMGYYQIKSSHICRENTLTLVCKFYFIEHPVRQLFVLCFW